MKLVHLHSTVITGVQPSLGCDTCSHLLYNHRPCPQFEPWYQSETTSSAAVLSCRSAVAVEWKKVAVV